MAELRTSERLLLRILSRVIRGERVELESELDAAEWKALRTLGVQQRLLPLLAEALYPGTALASLPGEWQSLHGVGRERTVAQAARTGEFLSLLRELSAQDLEPAVVKGIVCRSLYPQPEQRVSNDEDMLIEPSMLPAFHTALLACGLQLLDPSVPLEKAQEITYVDPQRDLYLELHMRPFPGDDAMWSDFNRAFDGALSRSVTLPIYGQSVRTLAPTDHLLFLLCHAYKHLIYSGVGIRQICDLCLFAERFGGEIDWPGFRARCAALGLEDLAAAMLRIGQNWLEIPAPEAYSDLAPDELPLLVDCLRGGLYGADDVDRVHSRAFTLGEVRAWREGRKSHGLLRSMFPKASSISGRYPCLKTMPWLLPAIWVHRAFSYTFGEKGTPGESIRIGRERIELLRFYGIIP